MRRRLALVCGELHAAQSDRSLQARSEEGVGESTPHLTDLWLPLRELERDAHLLQR